MEFLSIDLLFAGCRGLNRKHSNSVLAWSTRELLQPVQAQCLCAIQVSEAFGSFIYSSIVLLLSCRLGCLICERPPTV